MYLIGCSYEHIGPFSDRIYAIHFLGGATLIKAPIGSGKSFLFFDGPIFGLYKWSTRPMVSRHFSDGVIQVLFHHMDACWLVIRYLKSTKAGNDSVVSKLFRVHADRDALDCRLGEVGDGNMLIYDRHMQDVLSSELLEEVVSVGQREIDGLITDLLPPKEVTLSSCVLMQESDNIFEMTPATRIAVFKQLFDLLDMDAVKDRLAELRKITQTRRQVLQEDTTVQQQFTTLCKEVAVQYAHAQSGGEEYGGTVYHERKDQLFFQDVTLFQEQESKITGTFLQGYDPQITQQLLDLGEQHMRTYLAEEATYNFLHTQRDTLAQERERTKKQFTQLAITLQEKEKQMLAWGVDDRVSLQQEIAAIEMELEGLWARVPVAIAATYGYTFTSLTQVGQLLRDERNAAQQIQTKLQAAEEKKQLLMEQQTALQAQYDHLQAKRDRPVAESTHRFHCDKIQGDCPYVNLISKVHIASAQQQQDEYRQQLHDLEQRQLPELHARLSAVVSEITLYQQQTEQKRQFFVAIGRKEVEEITSHAEQVSATKELLTRKVRDLEQQFAGREEVEKRLQELRIQQEQLQESMNRLQVQDDEYAARLQGYSPDIIKKHLQDIKTWMHHLQTIAHHMEQMGGLLTTYLDRQHEVRLLQDKEQRLKELLQIFQKELLLVVLQDFLPVLEEVINSYLQQIVSFSLRFELPKTMQETIELGLWVEDEKGKRAVKSLSGGQRAVLRLCRILAVSTLFKQEYLLLDETITSLDNEAVGRVAEVLENFVKQRDLTFCLVTHAPQIQEMGFWRRVVEL